MAASIKTPNASSADVRCIKFCGVLITSAVLLLSAPAGTVAQLTTTFYSAPCPNLEAIVQGVFASELQKDVRVGASIVRLFFHDCFVQGCDASVLLSDTANFTGEQSAGPNANSLRGFSAVDNIKAAVESVCPGIVSCADILAITARDAVAAAGGPAWAVELGRRDGTTASQSGANSALPSPDSQVGTVLSQFQAVGLDQTDMMALAGAHTFGKARCASLQNRLYNFNGGGGPDPTLDTTYLATLQSACPQGGPGFNTVDLDQGTPGRFDNAYYADLIVNRGTFTSDQSFESSGGATAAIVTGFASNQNAFFGQFATSMINMGRISTLTGTAGEIRKICGVVNS